MNASLSITDPLAGQEVTIVISLTAGEHARDERPALVSAGVAGQRPATKTGVFGDVFRLIHEAYTAFGVQTQLAGTQAVETIAEEQVVATAGTGDADPTPTPEPRPVTPKPQTANLSLF
ncbi:MAG: hypothetical protein L0332_18040 [Chloroflexi bacterium]|nr:hypothetical protein [Chloroflexota bacterium]MCI0728602.1 hypothetical protein [Chloroflexota bacterium]